MAFEGDSMICVSDQQGAGRAQGRVYQAEGIANAKTLLSSSHREPQRREGCKRKRLFGLRRSRKAPTKISRGMGNSGRLGGNEGLRLGGNGELIIYNWLP